MQYLRARYYAPQNGSFVTQDSFAGLLTDALSQNSYTYAQNNPVNYIDPTGHTAKLIQPVAQTSSQAKKTYTVENTVTSAVKTVKNIVTSAAYAVKNIGTRAAQIAKSGSTAASVATITSVAKNSFTSIVKSIGKTLYAPETIAKSIINIMQMKRNLCDQSSDHVSGGDTTEDPENKWKPIYKDDKWWQIVHSDEVWVQYIYDSASSYQKIQDDMNFLLYNSNTSELNLLPVINSYLVSKMDSVQLKPAERLEAYNNLYAAAMFAFGDYHTKAVEMKIRFYAPKYMEDPRFEGNSYAINDWLNYDGNESNAFLHVYWNALMTYATDADTAFRFALAHEIVPPDAYENGFLDKVANAESTRPPFGIIDEYTGRAHLQMDLHNNEVGQRIGASIPHSSYALHQQLIKDVYNGNVQEYKRDIGPGGNYENLSDAEILIYAYVMDAFEKDEIIVLIKDK